MCWLKRSDEELICSDVLGSLLSLRPSWAEVSYTVRNGRGLQSGTSISRSNHDRCANGGRDKTDSVGPGTSDCGILAVGDSTTAPTRLSDRISKIAVLRNMRGDV